MKIPAYFAVIFAFLLVFSQQVAMAEDFSSDPHQLVRQVTDQLLEDIARYRQAMESATSRAERDSRMEDFLGELRATLEPVVDFQWIALNVMGNHRQAATPEQRERFREIFTRGLVETYGRGLLSYSDQRIVVHPPRQPVEDQRRVTVFQEIQGADGRYPLQYSMALNRGGDWKVVNVIINGINLGNTFRNQFSQAYSRHGDIDAVIDNWAVQNPAS